MELTRSKESKHHILITICARGTIAEWDASSHELVQATKLDLAEQGSIRQCTLNKTTIVTFQGSSN